MSRPLIIGMDVDDVVADLISEWLRRYRERTNHPLFPADIRTWEIAGYAKQMATNEFYGILHEPDLYGKVEPCAGAKHTVERLRHDGHRIVFISSCVGNTAGAKRDWLVHYGFLNRNRQYVDFIAANDKALVTGVDILVDDRVENVEAFPKASVLIRKPHNEDLTCWRPRAHLKDLPELLEYLVP
jgi:5'-nucleotidase